MKTLLILRHAKSSWKNSDYSDHARPLNTRGKSAAPRMGQLIYEEDVVPDVILSSTARRARDTADLVAEASGDCIQCHGGLDADKIALGVSPLVATEAAFTYAPIRNMKPVRHDPG